MVFWLYENLFECKWQEHTLKSFRICNQVIWVLQIKGIYIFVSYKSEVFDPTLKFLE